MDPITISAASGLRSRMESLELLANNLANAETSGYKTDHEFYGLYTSAEAFNPLGALRVLTLRTVTVAARVVRDAGEIALAAFFDMAAERGGATHFDGAHDAQLLKRQTAGFAVSVSVLSKNAGQLESGPAHIYLFGGGGFFAAVL